MEAKLLISILLVHFISSSFTDGQSPPEVEATPYFEDNEELNPDIGHTKQVKDDKTKGKNDEDATSQFDSSQYLSYLNLPHLHFKGNFIANVATGNNDIRNYDTATFMPHHILEKQEGGKGSWNPKGTNDFLLSNCKVASICYENETCTVSHRQDPAIGETVQDTGNGSPSKMVDIDPLAQFATEIYGLKLGINSIFNGDLVASPLQYFWRRQVHKQSDIGAAGGYQTILTNIKWLEGAEKSPFFVQLRKRMQETKTRKLSVRFYVDLFINRHIKQNFTKGRIVGTIGLSGTKSPLVSTWGRVLMAQNSNKYHDSQFILDKLNKKLIFDFGISFPFDNTGLPLTKNIGDLVIAYPKNVKKRSQRNCTTDYIWLGKIPYRNKVWIEDYAAILWIKLTDKQIRILENTPLVVLEIERNTTKCKAVVLREFNDGINIRPFSSWVFRKEAGEQVKMKLFATKFGKPLAGAKVKLFTPETEMFDSRGKCCTPPIKLTTEPFTTDQNGISEVVIETPILKTPRKFIDGQVYGVGYYIQNSQLQTALTKHHYYASDYIIIVKVYDYFTYKFPPNWVEHIHPIFKQYANLYPVMNSHTFDMSNYHDVVAHKDITKLSLNLPFTHPNLMPATRDLSKRKRRMINEWLDQENPAIGNVGGLLTLPQLKEMLQIAIQIEHSTIPPYLTALWSIRKGYNRQVHRIIKTIVRQEMLHMALAANILNAVGGKPSFIHSTFMPKYPSRLPGGVHPSLLVSLEKLSRTLLKNVFVAIEQPEKKLHHLKFRRSLFSHMFEFHYDNVCKILEKETSDCSYPEHKKDFPSLVSSFKNKRNCRKILDDFTHKITRRAKENKGNSFINEMKKDFFNHRDSIGAFYNQILLTLAKLTDCGADNSIFTGDPKRQVLTKGQKYGNGKLFGVYDYFDAVRAIQVILEEGQGASPCDPKVHYVRDVEDDVSHYALFNSIVEGRRVEVFESDPYKHKAKFENKEFYKPEDVREKQNISKTCPLGGYRYSGPQVRFIESAVWPIVSNPKPHMYDNDSNAAIFIKTFNRLYNRLLGALHESFNGKAKAFVNAKFLMYSIDYYGRQIVQMPLKKNGNSFAGPNAAPTFDWIPSEYRGSGSHSDTEGSRLPKSSKGNSATGEHHTVDPENEIENGETESDLDFQKSLNAIDSKYDVFNEKKLPGTDNYFDSGYHRYSAEHERRDEHVTKHNQKKDAMKITHDTFNRDEGEGLFGRSRMKLEERRKDRNEDDLDDDYDEDEREPNKKFFRDHRFQDQDDLDDGDNNLENKFESLGDIGEDEEDIRRISRRDKDDILAERENHLNDFYSTDDNHDDGDENR